MSQSQYDNRTYDVMAYQGVAAPGPVLLEPALMSEVSPGGTICTGIQKLVQRFLILLTTVVGSKPYSTAVGTSFMAELRAGQLRTELDVLTSFSMAVGAISSQLSADILADDPEDEIFADASVIELTLQPGAISMRIEITSVAGAAREIILPLTVAV